MNGDGAECLRSYGHGFGVESVRALLLATDVPKYVNFGVKISIYQGKKMVANVLFYQN